MPPSLDPIAPLVFGILAPRQRILGTELSGEIEAIDAAVTKFKAGDCVFAFPGFALGAHAAAIDGGYRDVVEHRPREGAIWAESQVSPTPSHPAKRQIPAGVMRRGGEAIREPKNLALKQGLKLGPEVF